MSRPRKKRSIDSAWESDEEGSDNLAISALSFSTRASSHSQFKPTFVSQHQLETLQAELDHERSLRALDRKRAQQVHQRLQKQAEFALEEAQEAKNLLEEVQSESERM
jgi:hypothetical protein